jgi:hypothetical protein
MHLPSTKSITAPQHTQQSLTQALQWVARFPYSCHHKP